MTRLLLIVFFLEAGLVLIIAPWSTWWDRNYFAQFAPEVHAFITNNFVRGAISGLGVVNVAAAVAELMTMLMARRGTGEPPTLLPGVPAPDARIEPASKQE